MLVKVGCCVALLFFTVAATLSTEASKSEDGTYPYNSLVVPMTVEAAKLFVSSCLLTLSMSRDEKPTISFSPGKFAIYVLPALCYFVSNNCMFFVILELGPSTFQIMSNLKVLATAILMRIFLGVKLNWLRWKALILLILGSVVTQMSSGELDRNRNSAKGHVLVFINCFASAAGGVISEKLLKGNALSAVDSIHWQNVQLYFFGLVFGLVGSWSTFGVDNERGMFDGFNSWAYFTVASLTTAGLLVSFILKYLDNFAKCFVAAVSIIFVAVIHAVMRDEVLHLNVVVGIALTCMALEQYNMPQFSESYEGEGNGKAVNVYVSKAGLVKYLAG